MKLYKNSREPAQPEIKEEAKKTKKKKRKSIKNLLERLLNELGLDSNPQQRPAF